MKTSYLYFQKKRKVKLGCRPRGPSSVGLALCYDDALVDLFEKLHHLSRPLFELLDSFSLQDQCRRRNQKHPSKPSSVVEAWQPSPSRKRCCCRSCRRHQLLVVGPCGSLIQQWKQQCAWIVSPFWIRMQCEGRDWKGGRQDGRMRGSSIGRTIWRRHERPAAEQGK